MKLSLKWLTPVLLRLLTLSHVSFADAFTNAAFNNPGSVHLVTGFYVGLAANSQPRVDLSLDTATFVPLASNQFALPVMPLHLLGKKSWNVYNQDNIAKVKRDEAAARAREEAEDERLQEIDSERRLQLLRGESLSALPPPPASPPSTQDQHHHPSSTTNRERKKRKRPGEDDTDFELRLARDQQQTQSSSSISTHLIPHPALPQQSLKNNAPLTDHTGHISLFPASSTLTGASGDPPSTKQEELRKKKEKDLEDRTTLRFSHAAGYDTSPTAAPWYSAAKHSSSSPPPSPKRSTSSSTLTFKHDSHPPSSRHDASTRATRDAARTASNDPLSLMRRGAAAVRRVDRERKQWVAEREREMATLARLDRERGDEEESRDSERARKRRKRRQDDDDEESLEGFLLDERDREGKRNGVRDDRSRDEGKYDEEAERRHRHRHRHRHGHGSSYESSSSRHQHRQHKEYRGQREQREQRPHP